MEKPTQNLYQNGDWNRESAVESGKSPEPYRHEGRRDYARLIHSPSFRRLQGKTQLFPSEEGDFFRNRLTHSLEVAQIAKSIAIRLNSTETFLKSKKRQINLDVVEFAGLAHDIGHPPFGHNGETALDQLMLDNGGFEGNAQTLRILTKLEKKATTNFPVNKGVPDPINILLGRDNRLGLNLTYRTIASILKYDNIIPRTKEKRKDDGSLHHPVKGYYHLETDIVSKIKKSVGLNESTILKSIECSIMDVADDIAYSTYDIEDSFKSGFLSPIKMISMSDEFKAKVANKVSQNINKRYADLGESEREFGVSDLNDALIKLFRVLFSAEKEIEDRLAKGVEYEEASFVFSARSHSHSGELTENGYLRTAFTSDLVGKFVSGIELLPNEDSPILSCVRLTIDNFKLVETLKHYSYQLLIDSPRLKITEIRGREIIGKIFETLMNDSVILPEDWRYICNCIDDASWKRRTVCDYIAGMTDRYCVELYSRITGNNPITMWKPH